MAKRSQQAEKAYRLGRWPMLLLVVAMVAASGVAWASSHGNEYYACLTNGGAIGKVTVDGSIPDCSSNQTVIHWNEVGPQGVDGLPGAAGPPGPEGPPAASGFYLRHTVVTAAAGELLVGNVMCDAGDLPMSGGYFIYEGGSPIPGIDPGPVYIFVNRYLVPTPTIHGWDVQGRNLSDSTLNMLVRVVCADIGSTPLPGLAP